MARTRTYQVVDNRIRYICSNCQAKRSLPVPPRTRSRSVRCHKCGFQERCNLNRRGLPREQQSGKADIIRKDGKEISIDICDISPGGVGVSTTPGEAKALSLMDEIQFKCGWNPRLFASGRYVVKSINGNRLGIQNMAYRSF